MKASDLYAQSVMNTAIKGKFLFQTLDEVAPLPGILRVNFGGNKWTECKDFDEVVQAATKLSKFRGLARALPWDFGIITNAEGEVLYRVSNNGRINAVKFIGMSGGNVEQRRIKFSEII